MAEPYFSEELTERQLAVMMHYIQILDVDDDKIHYIKSEQFVTDMNSIDIVVFEPTEKFNYYTVATVGLSETAFKTNFARSELLLTLPKTWKPIFDKEEYYWAPQLLRDIAYYAYDKRLGINIGQVYLLNDPDGKDNYSESTDAIGGIVTLAEMYPLDMYEREIDGTFTRFFQVVPITKDDVQKMDELGPLQFIQFNLHDSEGPLMVAKLKEKPVEGIDKLIKQNETALKGTDNNNNF